MLAELSFVLSQYTYVTDAQTNRRTDGLTIAETALHSMQRCKNATHNTLAVVYTGMRYYCHYVSAGCWPHGRHIADRLSGRGYTWLCASVYACVRLHTEQICLVCYLGAPVPLHLAAYTCLDRSVRSSLRPLRTLCNSRRLSVCLSVCLLATLRKNYWTDLHENFTTDVGLSVLTFGSHPPPDPDPGIFEGFFNIAR